MVKKQKTLKRTKTGKKAKVARKVAHVRAPKPRSVVDSRIAQIETEIQRYKVAVEKGEKVSPVTVSALEVEKEAEKEVRFFEKTVADARDMGSLSFYFLSSLISMAILAFFFGSITTFSFYFAFGLFLWWWSHHFHKTGSALLRSFLSLGSLVLFLYFFYWVFNDSLSIIICLLYSLSFVVSGVLFFYHFKREFEGEIHRSFPRTFLVMFYSHVIAFAAASVVAYVIPNMVLTDSFVSVIFILLVWIAPSLLVYFFFTKFLYLRFFDRKHIMKDVLKGIMHSAVYCAVFVGIILLAYMLTAMQLVMMARAANEDSFSNIYSILAEVEPDINAAFGDEVLIYKPASDTISLSESMMKEVTRQKMLMTDTFLLLDYLSDRYFTAILDGRFKAVGLSNGAAGLAELKDDIIREHAKIKRAYEAGLFDDGTTDIDSHYAALSRVVATEYVSPPLPPEFLKLNSKLDYINSYSVIFEDRSLSRFNVMFYPGFSVLSGGDSRFGKVFYDVFHHTVLFRDLMVFTFKNIFLLASEIVNPYSVSAMYAADGEELTPSKVLRYSVIKSDVDATIAAGA